MTKLNNDGLKSGQPVSWDEMVKANANRKDDTTELVVPDEPITRESIATMAKDDVIDLLKTHGVDEPGDKVGKLRDQLIAIMFVEL